MSTFDDPTPILGRLSLPDGFETSTSWERAKREPVEIDPLGRVRWFVKVGDGARHRVTFGLDGGHPVGKCDCAGHDYHGWCAHIAAMWQAHVRGDLTLADVSEPVDEENAKLWLRYRRQEA